MIQLPLYSGEVLDLSSEMSQQGQIKEIVNMYVHHNQLVVRDEYEEVPTDVPPITPPEKIVSLWSNTKRTYMFTTSSLKEITYSNLNQSLAIKTIGADIFSQQMTDTFSITTHVDFDESEWIFFTNGLPKQSTKNGIFLISGSGDSKTLESFTPGTATNTPPKITGAKFVFSVAGHLLLIGCSVDGAPVKDSVVYWSARLDYKNFNVDVGGGGDIGTCASLGTLITCIQLQATDSVLCMYDDATYILRFTGDPQQAFVFTPIAQPSFYPLSRRSVTYYALDKIAIATNLGLYNVRGDVFGDLQFTELTETVQSTFLERLSFDDREEVFLAQSYSKEYDLLCFYPTGSEQRIGCYSKLLSDEDAKKQLHAGTTWISDLSFNSYCKSYITKGVQWEDADMAWEDLPPTFRWKDAGAIEETILLSTDSKLYIQTKAPLRSSSEAAPITMSYTIAHPKTSLTTNTKYNSLSFFGNSSNYAYIDIKITSDRLSKSTKKTLNLWKGIQHETTVRNSEFTLEPYLVNVGKIPFLAIGDTAEIVGKGFFRIEKFDIRRCMYIRNTPNTGVTFYVGEDLSVIVFNTRKKEKSVYFYSGGTITDFFMIFNGVSEIKSLRIG